MSKYGVSTYGQSTGLTAEEIKNQALLMLGFTQEIDFDDTTNTTVQQVERIYETVLYDTLSNYPWRFALKRRELTERYDADDTQKYKYNYVLPLTLLAIKNPFMDSGYYSVVREYESSQKIINTDSTKVFLSYISVIDEADFPRYFVDYFKYRLARELCFPLTGDMNLVKLLAESERMFFRLAKNTDAKQSMARTISSSPFTSIRG